MNSECLARIDEIVYFDVQWFEMKKDEVILFYKVA